MGLTQTLTPLTDTLETINCLVTNAWKQDDIIRVDRLQGDVFSCSQCLVVSGGRGSGRDGGLVG